VTILPQKAGQANGMLGFWDSRYCWDCWDFRVTWKGGQSLMAARHGWVTGWEGGRAGAHGAWLQ